MAPPNATGKLRSCRVKSATSHANTNAVQMASWHVKRPVDTPERIAVSCRPGFTDAPLTLLRCPHGNFFDHQAHVLHAEAHAKKLKTDAV